MILNAIIMAGGQGTRLKPVTGDLPKPMVPLAGKPMLEHILALLRRSGVEHACLTLHYRPEVIRDYFGDGARFGVHLTYREEQTPLGTAGSVRACADFYGSRDFLVISGDCACDADLRPLMEAHRRHGAAVTMALYAHPQPLQYGIVLTDRAGRVVSFVEKPDWTRVVSDLVNTGIYVVSPRAMELVPPDTPFDFARDLFPLLLRQGQEIRGLPLTGYWCDVGTPRAYYQCCLDALDGTLRLDGAAPASSPPATATPPAAAADRVCACRSRARLMRVLSQTLMEAGADFSDGLRIESPRGAVHIAPAPDSEALRISADGADAAALARDYEKMIHDLEREN